ncbi:MAG: hypothetical protein AAFZ67_14670, partial [Planctomycetota bacterium]
MLRKSIQNVLWIALVAAGVLVAPSARAQTAAQFLEWLTQYTQGDLRADYNRNGVLSPADFHAFLLFHQGGGDGRGSADTGQPDGGGDDGVGGPETGWTEFEASRDTRTIYVAANGRDTNHGRSANRPVRTVAEGIRRLRDGRPDWLLLRRGDTFNESLGSNWSKSGRSAS